MNEKERILEEEIMAIIESGDYIRHDFDHIPYMISQEGIEARIALGETMINNAEQIALYIKRFAKK